MGNECRISELTKKKLAVKLTTGNQEREFIRICNQNEITIVRRNKEEGKNLQLPVCAYADWYKQQTGRGMVVCHKTGRIYEC